MHHMSPLNANMAESISLRLFGDMNPNCSFNMINCAARVCRVERDRRYDADSLSARHQLWNIIITAMDQLIFIMIVCYLHFLL